MPHVSRRLPMRPHLDVPKREARALLKQWRGAEVEALDRIRTAHPRFHVADDAAIAAGIFRLSDAQLVIAREYNFSSWPELKRRVEVHPLARSLELALRAGDCEQVLQILRDEPRLLHLPVRSGNWGPPMTFAANLGRLEIIQSIADLGAQDFQTALDRAVLQGKIECARWLLGHGAQVAPGMIMGPCETLNPEGVRFLAEAGAPFTDAKGDRLAPLALVLETYGRYPAGKHEILRIFAERGYILPDTPIMAFHRGQVDRLKQFLRNDQTLIERRFEYREIYLPSLGCHDDGRSGLHGTPIAGTTLLHLAIDFDEQEIFDLLLAHGADVNARASVDTDGFGGHTPLFNCVVSDAYLCGRQRDAAMARTLLARGASPDLRASLRKFLDWRAEPGWYQARDITAAVWGAGFPERDWANAEAMRLLAEH
jgi:ankyrin repeat protein